MGILTPGVKSRAKGVEMKYYSIATVGAIFRGVESPRKENDLYINVCDDGKSSRPAHQVDNRSGNDNCIAWRKTSIRFEEKNLKYTA